MDLKITEENLIMKQKQERLKFFEFKVGNYDLSFFLTRENRKSVAIKVFPLGKLIVKCPLSAKLEDVKIFLEKHIEWIQKHRLKRQNEDKAEEDDISEIYILGRKYNVSVTPSFTDQISIEDNDIVILTTKPQKSHIQKKLENWLMTNAPTVFKNRLKECLKLFPELTLPELEIKKLKSRYGSYSELHKVTLSLKLIHTSTQNIDFVICHELCHAYHMDHGKEFKRLLTSVLPNWKLLKSDLNAMFVPNLKFI